MQNKRGEIQRDLYHSMLSWKNNPQRLVLLLRGARQVGKTYFIEQFAKQHFEECVNINLEAQPEYAACFDTFNCITILNKIRLLSGGQIIPGKTLLFIDEIQECPRAIQALRYFKETQPDLHVVGAGSLLEFTLNSADFKMPVGRIESLFMNPLSFKEFLDAIQESHLRKYIESFKLSDPPDPLIHQHLLERTRLYALIGGMPAVVREYALTQNIHRVQVLQSALLDTYRLDFAKYARNSQYHYLKIVMDKAVPLVGTSFKYTQIATDIASRELKKALNLLDDAGIFHRVLQNTASGLPLKAFAKERGFKLLYLDIGLLIRDAQISPTLLLENQFLLANRGQLAEQWVGQALLAMNPSYELPQLYYWAREKTGAMAEVDYLTVIHDTIVPIEVKAGVTGRLKSLHIFLNEKNISLGVRISELMPSIESRVLSLPFYLVSELSRLYRSELDRCHDVH